MNKSQATAKHTKPTPYTMKKQPQLVYGREENEITRERAAYLLRAARSRRSGNVSRLSKGYALNDCAHAIIFESHTK